jgi:hypothetical protein
VSSDAKMEQDIVPILKIALVFGHKNLIDRLKLFSLVVVLHLEIQPIEQSHVNYYQLFSLQDHCSEL